MKIEAIENDFRKQVCEKVRLAKEGLDRYRAFTPFLFEDGDHPAIILRREQSQWVLSDEGHTYMHLTYDLDEKDLQKGTRQKIITNALAAFRVEDRDGELRVQITDNGYRLSSNILLRYMTKMGLCLEITTPIFSSKISYSREGQGRRSLVPACVCPCETA